jgi:hypothetical protein
MSDLAEKNCVPCKGGVAPLAGRELETLANQVPQWTVVNGHHLTRAFKFSDFAQALAFVNKVGAIAEQHACDFAALESSKARLRRPFPPAAPLSPPN